MLCSMTNAPCSAGEMVEHRPVRPAASRLGEPAQYRQPVRGERGIHQGVEGIRHGQLVGALKEWAGHGYLAEGEPRQPTVQPGHGGLTGSKCEGVTLQVPGSHGGALCSPRESAAGDDDVVIGQRGEAQQGRVRPLALHHDDVVETPRAPGRGPP